MGCDGRGADCPMEGIGRALAWCVQLEGQFQEGRKTCRSAGFLDPVVCSTILALPMGVARHLFNSTEAFARCKAVCADCAPCASSAVIVRSRETRSPMRAL